MTDRPDLDRYKALVCELQKLPIAARELIAGGIAGAAGKTCVAPLERIKILYQTGKLRSGGIPATLRAIFTTEGLPGLFKGNGASVLRIIPYASIHFGLYEYYRRLIIIMANLENAPRISPVVDLIAGSSAGASAVVVTYPLDLVRTRLAFATEVKSGSSLHPTIRSVLMNTLRLEGIRGLYHGLGPSMYGILPYAGVKFYVYQHMKQYYFHRYHREEGRLPTTVMLACGAVAGLAAQTLTYPFDVVRRRMQIEGLALHKTSIQPSTEPFLPKSTPKALVEMARRHGWRVLFAGLSINYLKVVPSTAIGFTLFDHVKQTLNLSQHL